MLHIIIKNTPYRIVKRNPQLYNKKGILYYIKIKYNGTWVYKLGFTTQTVEERINRMLKKNKKLLWKIISIYSFEVAEDAFNYEQILHIKYGNIPNVKYSGIHFLTSGNSELYNIDILGIDI